MTQNNIAIQAARNAMAELWASKGSPRTADRIRAGDWDDIDPVRSAIIGGLAVLALRQTPPAEDLAGNGESVALSAGTDDLVDRFASALKARLALSSNKPGRGEAWASVDWQAECQRQLIIHVAKGDPLDIAAYAAFCWHHGWQTVAPAPSRPVDREEEFQQIAFKALHEPMYADIRADAATAVARAFLALRDAPRNDGDGWFTDMEAGK